MLVPLLEAQRRHVLSDAGGVPSSGVSAACAESEDEAEVCAVVEAMEEAMEKMRGETRMTRWGRGMTPKTSGRREALRPGYCWERSLQVSVAARRLGDRMGTPPISPAPSDTHAPRPHVASRDTGAAARTKGRRQRTRTNPRIRSPRPLRRS
ncbi:hypothetical protein C8R45DRAFT_1013350 [Mycena sanguinolenta]|nr:hypothetical protein C8R45DRAFT_1013350 [Mycena sanguinolenta]